MKFKITFFSLFFIIISSTLTAQNKLNEKDWVDSVYNSLNLEERIAQLINVRANQAGEDYLPEVTKWIKNHNIGGVTFFKNDISKQTQQINYWQSISKTPLMVAMDAEYGVGMRIESVIPFPFQMTLGAIQNDSLIYEMGKAIAQQCHRTGIQMNFAPVIDINVNPNNPVINSRSFGEDKYNVSRKGKMYMKGLQDENIIATAKHFPGHGDTNSDSHYTLPLINHNKQRLDSIELYPFKQLIKNNLGGIMVAHLYIPAYEKGENIASTLSYPIITDLLRKKLGFQGLIVTDALDMKGVTKYHKPGDIELKAFTAGNDILLLPVSVPKAIRKISKAVKNGEIDKKRIEESCKKILTLKYRTGLANLKGVSPKNINEDLNNPKTKFLIRELYKGALTIVKNQDSLLPLKRIDTLRIASLTIGNKEKGVFQNRLEDYAPVNHFYLDSEITSDNRNKMLEELKTYNLVIVGVQNTSISAYKKFGITPSTIDFVNTLQQQNKIVLDVFANPYSLAYFNTENIPAIVMSYQDNSFTHDLSAQLIFGGIKAKGLLPVSANKDFPINTGYFFPKTRLEFSEPEAFNISEKDLFKVDSIALYGIQEKAYPGCQIMAIKDGQVFYQKSFGKPTYTSNQTVQNKDLYDIASITKIVATTISVMKLFDEGKIDIDEKLSRYHPYFIGSNKENIIYRDLLTHQARFQAWIPYFRATIDSANGLNKDIYQFKMSDKFPIRVAENLYIKRDYAYRMMDSIIISPLREKTEYKYSDIGFYILAKTIETLTNQPIDEYADTHFYKPMGLMNITYRPRDKFPLSRLIPTEDDQFFRKQLIHGDVHDPGAAMLGGVSGHAGIFSNTHDIGVIMQMLLNGGTYGGERYIKESTVKEFTRYQFPLHDNRRGLGFDKPFMDFEPDGPNCASASTESFGHSGFTGTYAWADPKNGLIYVFLSNRVHPDASNSTVYRLNIRTNIHQAFYDALKNATK